MTGQLNNLGWLKLNFDRLSENTNDNIKPLAEKTFGQFESDFSFNIAFFN